MILKDNLVSSFISNLKQGPHLYGIFNMGRVEQYFECRTLTQQEMKLPKYSTILAREVALFHALQIPIIRDPDFMFNNSINKLEKIMSQSFDNPEHAENHEQFLSFGIQNELDKLM